jgi:hypothetical protein
MVYTGKIAVMARNFDADFDQDRDSVESKQHFPDFLL